MRVGYIRVSTTDQKIIRQEVLMEAQAIEKFYIEKESGKNMERPQLQAMMDYVRENDVVVVESISRFARNTKDLLQLVERLIKKGVQFVSLKESIDTSTPTGRLMLTIFGAVAELERESILQRQREGIDAARAAGQLMGRPKKDIVNFEDIYNEHKSKRITSAAAARRCGISRSTWYRKLREYEEEQVIDF